MKRLNNFLLGLSMLGIVSLSGCNPTKIFNTPECYNVVGEVSYIEDKSVGIKVYGVNDNPLGMKRSNPVKVNEIIEIPSPNIKFYESHFNGAKGDDVIVSVCDSYGLVKSRQFEIDTLCGMTDRERNWEENAGRLE
jgi:hypothetical protein